MHFSDIDNGKPFDWGNTSKDYAKYRDIYPEEFYQSIIDLGLCKKGQTSHYAVHAWLHHHVGTPYLWYNIYNLKGHDGVRCDMKDRVL